MAEQRAQKHDRFLRGRQVANMIYDDFRATGACDAAHDLSDFFNIYLPDDDTHFFDTRWGQAPLTASEVPPENVLEGLYKLKIRGSVQVQTVVAVRRPRNASRSSSAKQSKFEDHGKATH